jgi:rubrerythrin
LCLAEGGEVTHYEVLAAVAKKVKLNKNKQIFTTLNSILRQEQKHLKLCTTLAKEVAAS